MQLLSRAAEHNTRPIRFYLSCSSSSADIFHTQSSMTSVAHRQVPAQWKWGTPDGPTVTPGWFSHFQKVDISSNPWAQVPRDAITRSATSVRTWRRLDLRNFIDPTISSCRSQDHAPLIFPVYRQVVGIHDTQRHIRFRAMQGLGAGLPLM